MTTSGATPWGITAGSDGNLWFTEYQVRQIGRITPNGTITEFSSGPIGCLPQDITSGPDGNLWYVCPQGGLIVRMTTAGVYTTFAAGYGTPYGITSGPDGNIWVTQQNNGGQSAVVRVTPSTGAQTAFLDTSLNGGFHPGAYKITTGSDGNLWWTHDGNAGSQGELASVTPSGTITEWPFPSADANSTAEWIVGKPADGQLWFWITQTAGLYMARITTSGTVTVASSGGYAGTPPLAIGPDGNVWSANEQSAQLMDFAEDFTPTIYPGQSSDPSPGYCCNISGIVTGPDGNVWFTEQQTNKIGRLNVAGDFGLSRRRRVQRR